MLERALRELKEIAKKHKFIEPEKLYGVKMIEDLSRVDREDVTPLIPLEKALPDSERVTLRRKEIRNALEELWNPKDVHLVAAHHRQLSKDLGAIMKLSTKFLVARAKGIPVVAVPASWLPELCVLRDASYHYHLIRTSIAGEKEPEVKAMRALLSTLRKGGPRASAGATLLLSHVLAGMAAHTLLKGEQFKFKDYELALGYKSYVEDLRGVETKNSKI